MYFILFEREKRDFLFAGSLRTWMQWPGRTRPKPGARNSIQVSHVGDRCPNALLILCCLPRHIAGNWMGSGVAGTQLTLQYEMPVSHRWWLNPLHHSLASI